MIRKAEAKDASRIAEVHIFAWRTEYKEIIAESYLYNEISVSGRIKDYIDRKENEIHEMYVYEDKNIIKGFMKIRVAEDEDKKESFELWGLYIEPTMQRIGVGTKLLRYCEEIAKERGYKENILWVFKENNKAKQFYEKNGYKKDHKEKYIEAFNAVEVRYCKKLG